MNEVTLEERMARLERQNRRLKVGMLALGAVVAGFVCIAATKPAAKVVRAQKFEVVDAKGMARAALALLPDGGPGLTFLDERGKPRAALGLRPDGGPSLTLFDGKGKPRADLSLRADGGLGLTLADEKGEIRAVLGATSLETTRTGEVAKRAESSLVLFDKDGKVLWKAP